MKKVSGIMHDEINFIIKLLNIGLKTQYDFSGAVSDKDGISISLAHSRKPDFLYIGNNSEIHIKDYGGSEKYKEIPGRLKILIEKYLNRKGFYFMA